MFVHMIQPVIQPVVKPVSQPVVSCVQTFNRLSNRLFNRFENQLYRVNGVSHSWLVCCTVNGMFCTERISRDACMFRGCVFVVTLQHVAKTSSRVTIQAVVSTQHGTSVTVMMTVEMGRMNHTTAVSDSIMASLWNGTGHYIFAL